MTRRSFDRAYRNGRVAFESELPMMAANPYHRGAPSWIAFIDGYLAAYAAKQGGRPYPRAAQLQAVE
jgi:hypothetical protein